MTASLDGGTSAIEKGDAYVAAAGSTHDDFVTETGATYLSIFKL